jgi:hypothetical protein
MTTLPTTKHALVIQGGFPVKENACIEIVDWATKKEITIHGSFGNQFSIPLWTGSRIIAGNSNLYDYNLLISDGYTIHHTVESFMKVFEVEESEPTNLPIEFVEWYSGMTREKILKAVERWKRESTIQEFKPIELTNLKN